MRISIYSRIKWFWKLDVGLVIIIRNSLGLFSMVAAQAGAKHVYGIEDSKIVS